MASFLGRLVQPPANGRGDGRSLASVQRGKAVQPVEHPLQGDEGAVAVRTVIDVKLHAAAGAERQSAVNEVGQVLRCPPMIAAEARAGDGVDHHLQGCLGA